MYLTATKVTFKNKVFLLDIMYNKKLWNQNEFAGKPCVQKKNLILKSNLSSSQIHYPPFLIPLFFLELSI